MWGQHWHLMSWSYNCMQKWDYTDHNFLKSIYVELTKYKNTYLYGGAQGHMDGLRNTLIVDNDQHVTQLHGKLAHTHVKEIVVLHLYCELKRDHHTSRVTLCLSQVLILWCIMLKNGQTYFKNLATKLLKYVSPFLNSMHERFAWMNTLIYAWTLSMTYKKN